MFIRKNKNRSGSISIQIISKKQGQYKVIEIVGTAKNKEEIEELYQKAQTRLKQIKFFNQPSLFFYPDEAVIKNFVENLSNSNIHVIGPELIFGKLFDSIGFNKINDELFRHIVIARLSYPASKLKTVDYLQRYKNVSVSVDSIYRFLDKLQNSYSDAVKRIAFEHTKKILKGNIAVVFYDMTTIYFEAADEDDLRKIGFSKDGKFQKPQIMLGLLVGEYGYPIGYDIFKGNTFEGHTLLPIINKIQKKYGFKQPIIVADAALLSKKNIENLVLQKYKFIIGARIKNENDQIKQKILQKSKNMKNGNSFIIRKENGIKLIVSFSDKRAKKDSQNRTRGINKLRQRVKSGKLTKDNINNRGYNKFLTLTGEINVEIDERKINEDTKWDGLKGYITNTHLSSKNVIANYSQLWQIENAFRISKTDLRIRPIYHQIERRIQAHICIAFVAYAIYKELERVLHKEKNTVSVKRACELTHTMYGIEYLMPKSLKKQTVILKMNNEQEMLRSIIQKYVGG